MAQKPLMWVETGAYAVRKRPERDGVGWPSAGARWLWLENREYAGYFDRKNGKKGKGSWKGGEAGNKADIRRGKRGQVGDGTKGLEIMDRQWATEES